MATTVKTSEFFNLSQDQLKYFFWASEPQTKPLSSWSFEGKTKKNKIKNEIRKELQGVFRVKKVGTVSLPIWRMRAPDGFTFYYCEMVVLPCQRVALNRDGNVVDLDLWYYKNHGIYKMRTPPHSGIGSLKKAA